jgi:hypothetical protein
LLASPAPTLIGMQNADGSWTQQVGSEGPLCATAMALLALEINYNFLAIYQR